MKGNSGQHPFAARGGDLLHLVFLVYFVSLNKRDQINQTN
jgi:hypothetical protein